MPSQRRRIGFLPSEEVHNIIDKICRTNNFSQSKVTGLLVEEALRSRGVLSDSYPREESNNSVFKEDPLNKEPSSNNHKTQSFNDFFEVNNKLFLDDIKMVEEYIKFKHFKKIMNQNKDTFNK